MSKKKSIYDFHAKTAEGKLISLKDYKNKVMLIVNTASKCGFTPQYKGLQELHKKYSQAGLVILGFPCNQFANQEPGTAEEVKKSCLINYGVTFQIFEKINVNGQKSHPLFSFLKSQKRGILGSKKIKWNFTKFLVDRDGNVIKRIRPSTKPHEFEEDILSLL